MAISATHKASLYSGTNATSYATGSWTPTANMLAIVCVQSELSGVPAAPTLSGNGITWSQLTTYLDDASGTQSRITVFVGKTGASPSAGATTADFGAVTQAGCNIIVDEFDGTDLSGTALQAIVQNKTGSTDSGTSETIVLNSSITAGNASYGTFHHQSDEGTTAGSSHTELGDGSHAGPSSALTTVFKVAGSQTVSASWTTSAGRGGVALEIKAASGGSPVSIVLDVALLAATGRALLDVVPGAVSKLFDTATLTSTPRALDVMPGAVVKLFDTAVLTISGRLLDVITISSVLLDTSSLVANGQDFQVVKGQAVIELEEALLLSSGQSISFIMGSVTTGIDTASLIANGNIIGVLIGGDILLDTANLSALGIPANINVGQVVIVFDAASVIAAAHTIDLIQGEVNIIFDTANIQSVAQISNVAPGEYVVIFNTAETEIVSYDITISAPFINQSVSLDSALLQISSEIAIMPGNVLVSLDTALLVSVSADVVISAILAVVKHWTLSDRSTLLSIGSRSTLLNIEERSNEFTLNEDDR